MKEEMIINLDNPLWYLEIMDYANYQLEVNKTHHITIDKIITVITYRENEYRKPLFYIDKDNITNSEKMLSGDYTRHVLIKYRARLFEDLIAHEFIEADCDDSLFHYDFDKEETTSVSITIDDIMFRNLMTYLKKTIPDTYVTNRLQLNKDGKLYLKVHSYIYAGAEQTRRIVDTYELDPLRTKQLFEKVYKYKV